MATESRNKLSTLSQTRSGALAELVRRLRDHAKTIKNRACQAMGQDMLAAALAIEQQAHTPAGRLVEGLTVAEAMALAQMAEQIVNGDAVQLSGSAGDAEIDALLGGIEKLRSALAGAGFAPH